MEDEKALAIAQACREFEVDASDLVCFIQAISKISPEDAKKTIWMATGMALAVNSNSKEINQ
ncbi:MAG: hypothetical protein K2H66_00980 [Oscillospiraceae bacterium]|nr:hypothetical protein [Oscillospiraceae bacterium]